MNSVAKMVIDHIISIGNIGIELRERRYRKGLKKEFDYPDSKKFDDSSSVLGIARERWDMHLYYVAACYELGVSYVVIDIMSNNWLGDLRNSEISVLVVRPTVVTAAWKKIFDDKIRVLEKEIGLNIYPCADSLWLWESKHRTSYWLDANNMPHVEYFTFSRLKDALEFSRNCDLPIVFKSETGSGSRGVKIFRNRLSLKMFTLFYFLFGYRPFGATWSDREWGGLYFQKYVDADTEWRIIRIGESYFGYKKVKKGDYHSGSQKWEYGYPPVELLTLAKRIGNEHGFNSVSIDIFVSKGKPYVINEIQPYFGMEYKEEMLEIDGAPGRLYESGDSWSFQKGNFCRNKLCNERIKHILGRQ